MKIPITIIGFAARIISAFIPVQKKHWVFGADYGNMYREGPKYLLEYNFKSAKNIFDVNTALYSSNCKDSRNKLRLLLKTIINRDSDKEKNKKMFTQIVAYFLNKKEIVLQTKEEYE